MYAIEKTEYNTFTVASGLFKQSIGESEGRWLVRIKDENGDDVRGSFSVKKLGESEAFTKACEMYLEVKGELVFKVSESELPVNYDTLLKSCESDKREIFFQQQVNQA